MDPFTISWAGAATVVASVVAITVGVSRIMAQGRGAVTMKSLAADHTKLNERVQGVEIQMVRLESDLEGTLTTQMTDLKSELRRLDSKMDTVVSEVVKALASLKKE